MKVCLAIETTGRYLGLTLHRLDKPGAVKIASFFKEVTTRQSDLLLPTLEKLLRRARVQKKDLGLIAVDIGPGSFTGVRVGLAAARAIAQGLKLPLVGVSSLEAMAWPVVQTKSRPLVITQLEALASECYFAAYQGTKTILAPCWKPQSEFQKFLARHKKAVVVQDPAHSDDIGAIALQRYREKPGSKEFHFENVHPLYLQPTWAERLHR